MIATTICPHCGLNLSSNRDPEQAEAEPNHAPDVAPEPDSKPEATESVAVSHDPTGSSVFAQLEEMSSPEQPPPSALLGINLDQSISRSDTERGSNPASPSSQANSDSARQDADDEAHEEADAARSAWPIALLAGYASAMTLACGWLWWSQYRAGGANRDHAASWAAGLANLETAAVSEGEDAGHRAGASCTVEPAEPIAESLRVALGDSLRVEALEITPLNISSGMVELHRSRVDGRTERRSGGTGTLQLRLRLRNVSEDVIFAPLDEAFIREPDRRLPETFVEDASGTRVYAYRLPVSSEWSIAGQEFSTLRPGEEIETIVVSDTDAESRLNGPLTWRLRLRTAPESTAALGVTFDATEIRTDR